ncbi:MAG: hypothetical protein KBC64_04925 [Simkaniaceae bacterium]|nr:hypothetical protein [Simkaniaceae bacterium]
MMGPTKGDLRAFYRRKRDEISKERRREAEDALMELLWPKLIVYPKVLSFAPMLGEIDLSRLNEALAAEGRVLFPYLEKGEMKVDGEFNCILVPGIGFDPFHHRLGYGKGHFDRFLKHYPKCPTYGIAFREQRIEDPLPIESHDVALTHVFFF